MAQFAAQGCQATPFGSQCDAMRVMYLLSFLGTVVLAGGVTAQARSNTGTTSHAPAAAQNGIYTAAQAARGEKLFTSMCLECHGRKDMSSEDFRLKWNGRTAHDLFNRISTTMPENDPGALTTNEYLDVVAYLLKLNGMPEGRVALPPGSAALKQRKLVFPPR